MALRLIQSRTWVIVMTLLASATVYGDDVTPEAVPSPTTPALETDPPVTGVLLPPPAEAAEAKIDAKVYDVRIIRPSKSGRVYLFEKQEAELPMEGRILLLREGSKPMMAFRVLKTYPEKKQIAAKKIRVYPGTPALKPESRYRAYEKTGDISAPPAPTASDKIDLNDIEKPAAPLVAPPAEPIAATPEAIKKPEDPMAIEGDKPALTESDKALAAANTPTSATESEADDSDDSAEVSEDDTITDHYPNWFFFDFGMLKNSGAPDGPFQRGGGLVYGRNFIRGIFLDHPQHYDSFTLDLGAFYYKSNDDSSGTAKSFTLIPLEARLRYNRPLGESVTLFFYAGILYNYVSSQINATPKDLALISGIAPGLGAGLLIQTGPNWFIKVGLGIDAITAGVGLRY